MGFSKHQNKIFAKFVEIHAVFNLITFQTKGLQLYWKRTSAYALFLERWQAATSEISSRNQPDKYSEAAVRRCFSK